MAPSNVEDGIAEAARDVANKYGLAKGAKLVGVSAEALARVSGGLRVRRGTILAVRAGIDALSEPKQ